MEATPHFVCVYMYKNLTVCRLAYSHTHPSFAVASLRTVTLAVWQFHASLGMVWHKMCALDMHEATPTFLKHILKLAGSHIQHYTSHLPDPWLAICWYIPSYLPAIRKISNVCLGFSYPGHRVIWVSSCDPVSMLIWTLPGTFSPYPMTVKKKWSGQIRLPSF